MNSSNSFLTFCVLALLSLFVFSVPAQALQEPRNVSESRPAMQEFVFMNKSFARDLEPSLRLYKSFEQFVVPKNVPFYIVVPQQDVKIFRRKFLSELNQQEIKRLPIFVTDQKVFKRCGPRVYNAATTMPGWHSQQVVKMCFSKVGVAKNYMTLDSDLYFVRDFNISMLFHAGIIKTYSDSNIQRDHCKPDAPAKAMFCQPFLKIKAMLRDDSPYSQDFIADFALWSSDRLADLEKFFGNKYDFADLINISPWEMQWYGNFIYKWHRKDFFPLDQSIYSNVRDRPGFCRPTRGYPWTYLLSYRGKEPYYINRCSRFMTFCKNIKWAPMYVKFFWNAMFV